MTRVLMIEYFLPFSTYTVELARELSKCCELTVLCKENYEPPADLGLDFRPVLHYYSSNKIDGLVKTFGDFGIIREAIREISPEVIHIQGFCHPLLEIPFFLYERRSKRFTLAYTVHNALSHESKHGEAYYLDRWYRGCDLVFVHNKATVRQLPIWLCDDNRVIVAPHGFYNKYKTERKTKKGDTVHFLMFGQLRHYKGIDILIEAVALLDMDVRSRCIFTIAGAYGQNGSCTDYEQVARDKGVDDYFDFRIGYVEDDEIPRIFNQVDFCVFPYRSISGSGALLMAMTFEKPVVASNLPTFEEELNGAGLIFESESVEALARTIERCVRMSNYEYGELCERIRETKQFHSWTNSARIIASAYSEKGRNVT